MLFFAASVLAMLVFKHRIPVLNWICPASIQQDADKHGDLSHA